MSTRSRNRASRLRDFRQRAYYDPDSVLSHGDSLGEYIPVHPFADDSSLLAELGVKPGDCRSVDADWRIRGDVVFVQVSGSPEEPGYYARLAREHRSRLNLVAVLPTDSISRADFEAALAWFHRSAVFGRRNRGRLGPRLVAVRPGQD